MAMINLVGHESLYYMPPCIANEDIIRTNALITPHENGIQVDMRKKPALYTPASLDSVSSSYQLIVIVVWTDYCDPVIAKRKIDR